jgi:hypothetical protein
LAAAAGAGFDSGRTTVSAGEAAGARGAGVGSGGNCIGLTAEAAGATGATVVSETCRASVAGLAVAQDGQDM